MSRHFSKDIQTSKKHIKRHSVFLIIKEMQTKTTMDTTSHQLGWLFFL